MDGFRIREIRDVLTLEELKERVDTVDVLFTTIEVSNLNLTIAIKWYHVIIVCTSVFPESKS